MSIELIERLKNEGDGVMSRREKLQIADRIEELEDKVDSLEREISAYESWKDIINERDALKADNARLREALMPLVKFRQSTSDAEYRAAEAALAGEK